MKAYKGFTKEMTCHGGFQYEEGKTYHEDNAELCDHGFHACEYPLDCFTYFPPAKSVFYEVELDGRGNKANESKIKLNKANESKQKLTKDIRHKTNDIRQKTQDNDINYYSSCRCSSNLNTTAAAAAEIDQDFAAIVKLWDNSCGNIVSYTENEMLQDLFTRYGADKMNFAIKECVKAGVVNIRYLEAVLQGKKRNSNTSANKRCKTDYDIIYDKY